MTQVGGESNLSIDQIRLVIKVQARFRGFLDRKRVKKLHAELHSLGGMGGKKFDLSAPTNYDNKEVKVINLDILFYPVLVKKTKVRSVYI